MTFIDRRILDESRGSWRGAFTIELQPGANTHYLPKPVVISGNRVSIWFGRMYMVVGAILFEVDRQFFSWRREQIKIIRDGNGRVIWENQKPP